MIELPAGLMVVVVAAVVFSVAEGSSTVQPPYETPQLLKFPAEVVEEPKPVMVTQQPVASAAEEEDDYHIWNPPPVVNRGWSGAPIPHAKHQKDESCRLSSIISLVNN
ncbi:hypothetical protein ACP275_03G070800 [Erythranthe tilingii]